MRYEFRITLAGEGDDEVDAWIDACESFERSPGLPPDDFEIDYEPDNQVDWVDELALGDSTNGAFEDC